MRDVGDVIGFSIDEIMVDGRPWVVAVADTVDLRRRGLMFVELLGDLDGMLFVFEEDRAGGFWMKNTLIPLDIAFFDGSGELVEVMSMVPCEEDPCPSYRPSSAYRYALEAPLGDLAGMSETARIEY